MVCKVTKNGQRLHKHWFSKFQLENKHVLQIFLKHIYMECTLSNFLLCSCLLFIQLNELVAFGDKTVASVTSSKTSIKVFNPTTKYIAAQSAVLLVLVRKLAVAWLWHWDVPELYNAMAEVISLGVKLKNSSLSNHSNSSLFHLWWRIKIFRCHFAIYAQDVNATILTSRDTSCIPAKGNVKSCSLNYKLLQGPINVLSLSLLKPEIKGREVFHQMLIAIISSTRQILFLIRISK